MEHEDVFRTDRLVVRRWREADEHDILALYSMKSVVRWIDDGQSLSASDAARWIRVTRDNYQKRGYGMFAIERLDRSKTIGFGGLVHPGNQSTAEVKYALLPDVWGKGYATEFVRGLLRYGNCAQRLARIVATVAEQNAASKRVLIKSGFHQSGTRTENDGSRTEIYEVRF